MRTGRAGRSLRARLVLCTSLVLCAVCVTMALTTVLVQRARLLDELDQRVRDAAARSQGGARHRAGGDTDLSFLSERGQPAGTVAARTEDGRVTAAEVVARGGARRSLTADQRAALTGVPADGVPRTRTIPGLGTYRVTAVVGDGADVLAALPMAAVRDTVRQLVVTETVIAVAGIAVVEAAWARWSYGGNCAPWGGWPPPPPRSRGRRWTAARSAASPGSRPGTPTRAPRPVRWVPR